ncbi:MAG: phosphoglycerate kinase [Nanoarchaeota archaeon]
MKLRKLAEINVRNKKILLRIDVNSPVVNGKILDNPRFEASAKTIKYLINKNAKVVVIAHQGRKGDRDFTSLEQHAKILSNFIGRKVEYVDDLFGNVSRDKINNLNIKDVIILRNVREYNDEINIEMKGNKYREFCGLFDLYINEAFSVSHRLQGSIILPPRYLPCAIGLEFENELKALSKFENSRGKNKVFILGGSKVEDYIPLFKFLKDKRNKMLCAGVLANLFLIIKGYDLGYESKWLKDNNYFSLIPKLKKIYSKYKNQIILPVDFGLLGENGKRVNADLNEIPYDYKIYDVNEKTIELFKDFIDKADYIFMKGPLGFSEIDEFSYGTKKLLEYISELTSKKNVFSIIGGGHLTTTIKKYKILNKFSYNSLSGGALIKYISGDKLLGIVALEKSRK